MGTLTSTQLGERIREARKRRGMTQDDLAQQTRLERTAVNKVEAGLRKVTALELADIASSVGVRMASFFEDPVPAVVSHRSSQGLDTVESQIDAVLAEVASEVEFVHGLAAFVSSGPETPWERPASLDDAESMAERARAALGIGTGEPLTDLVSRCAELGLYIFTRPLGADTADAGTVLLPRGAVSLVNSSNKVGRRRLSAVHELAHYLVADEYTVDWRVADDGGRLESRFDHFARAVLLPPRALALRWEDMRSRLGLRDAAVRLASEYQVDMATLARRLQDLGVMESSDAASVRGVRTTRADIIEFDLYPGDELADTSQPRLYQQTVLRLVREERISPARGADLLWGTLAEDELPDPRPRDATAIWGYVS